MEARDFSHVRLHKGSPSVSIGIYASVLLAIGLQDDLLKIAGDDVIGRAIEENKRLRTHGKSK